MTGLLRAGLSAAVAVRGARAVADVLTRPEDPRWTRTNHRGEQVSLLEGPALATGLALGVLVGGGGARASAACLAAIAAGAAFGIVDDLSEDTSRHRKGLRGHLGALRSGELTTGGLKVLGIGAGSLVAAAIATPGPSMARGLGPAVRSWSLDVVTSGALIAATANLVNLLDLRPGRALKAGILAAAPALLGPGRAPAAAAIGGAAACLGDDLGERDMLGDGGANALGALVGTAAALSAPRALRLVLLGAAVALTIASERMSFTEVIARTPTLRRLDAWGRRA
jgi:UDP-N-acetylmuramyl pentapeptide phosphotransferase/UDP-N-acetylglucosamine-1-phosphate transferase